MFYYQTYRDSNGNEVNYKEAVPGTGNFNVKVNGPLPSDAVPALVGSRPLVEYTLESLGVLNPYQFGTGKYYSPKFKFNPDVDGWHTPAERKAIGVNQFTRWNVRDQDQASLAPGDGFYFMTENFLGDMSNGYGFTWRDNLQGFVTNVYNKLPSMGKPGDWEKYLTANFNIEAPLFNEPGNYREDFQPSYPGFGNGDYTRPNGGPDWNLVKNNSIFMESTGETVTLEQLALRGHDSWYMEYDTRFATRMSILCELIRLKGAVGTKVTTGMTSYIALPNRARKNDKDLFKNANCNVNHVGGVNGNITFNLPTGEQWTVNLTGPPINHEDFGNITVGLGFHECGLSAEEYGKIFIQKLPETQNIQYIWSKQEEWGIVPEEKARLQHNRQRQLARTGRNFGILRELNMHYETHQLVLPWLRNTDGTEAGTRLFFPPYQIYSRYHTTRFYAGDEEGWGFHLFPQNPTQVVRDPATDPDPNFRSYYNFSLHCWTALYQARADLQFLEAWFPGTTFVENPDVQIGMSGNWENYDGIDAWDQYPNPQKPAFMARYKASEGGTRVVIQGGEKLGWTQERTHNVRLPGGVLGGNTYQLKLRGPGAHLFDFFVPSTAAGQTFIGLNLANPDREKPGYAGSVKSN